MNKMLASTRERYGSPDILQVKEVDTPQPGDSEMLVRVYASTVNRTDCAILRAKPFIMRFFTGLFSPRKKITGTDFAGLIIATGKQVKAWNVGDKIFGFDDLGLLSHAQYMAIDESKAFAKMPKNLDFVQAAASLEGVHYAYNTINKVDLKIGQKALVNGATGAIGSAMVQLLKYYGLHVTAVGNTKNIDRIYKLGADHLIDYKKEDFKDSLDRFDYVFDAVGKSSFFQCNSLLKPGGVYISSELGWMAQNVFLSLATIMLSFLPGKSKRKKVLFPFPYDIKRSILFVSQLIEENKFQAVIDREYTLKDIADAYRYVETGEKTGNVMVIPNKLEN